MDPLASPDELNVHLQREVEPDRAALALQLASGAVRAYCGWDLSRQNDTLLGVGQGTIVVTLPTLWLEHVEEIRIDGEVLDLDPVKVTWTRRGQIIRTGGWAVNMDVEVDCVHGFDPTPDLLKLVTLEQAARSLANPQQLVQATVGAVSRTYGTANQPRLSELDQRLLDKYRI